MLNTLRAWQSAKAKLRCFLFEHLWSERCGKHLDSELSSCLPDTCESQNVGPLFNLTMLAVKMLSLQALRLREEQLQETQNQQFGGLFFLTEL